MKEDSSLFKHGLAAVLITKNNARYLREWIEYHLLAGVDHFYIYDNDGTDNLQEVLKPYIDAKIVDCKKISGKSAQCAAYNDAVENYRFDCRYMAFIDDDEFILPRGTKSVKDVLAEVLEKHPVAAGLTVNWHVFGAGRQTKADYSHNVMERFMYRTPDNFVIGDNVMNSHVKTIANPRCIDLIFIPHFAVYLEGKFAINSNGDFVPHSFDNSIPDDKIIINHYYTKSEEEYTVKVNRGRADATDINHRLEDFHATDIASTIFDDSILKYRHARSRALQSENGRVFLAIDPLDKINSRLTNALLQNVMPAFVAGTSREFFGGKLDTFLTCRAVSHSLADNWLDKKLAECLEELSLRCVYYALASDNLQPWQFMLLLKELPKLLKLEYESLKDIKIACRNLLPQMLDYFRLKTDWHNYEKMKYIAAILDN